MCLFCPELLSFPHLLFTFHTLKQSFYSVPLNSSSCPLLHLHLLLHGVRAMTLWLHQLFISSSNLCLYFPGLLYTSSLNPCSPFTCPTSFFSLSIFLSSPPPPLPSHPSSPPLSVSSFLLLINWASIQVFFLHTSYDGLERLNVGVETWFIFFSITKHVFIPT